MGPTNTRRPPAKDALAEGLGWFSVGLGTAQLAMPRVLCRVAGLSDRSRNAALLRGRGATEIAKGLGILMRPKPKSWFVARLAGDALDLVLLTGALVQNRGRRRRVLFALSNVAAVTAADALEVQHLRSSDAPPTQELDVKKAITVNKPPDEVYAFWRRFENFPRFMTHVESVEERRDGTSHWVVKAPTGTVEWEAEITDERPGELLAWRALPGSSIANRGSVRFAPAPGGRGTEVEVELRYEPPAGTLGATVAKLRGEEPATQLSDDLRRFKQVIETGEIVRSEGSLGGHSLFDHLKQRAAQPPTPQQASEAVSGGVA
jgi:uncharacterized membrane protein